MVITHTAYYAGLLTTSPGNVILVKLCNQHVLHRPIAKCAAQRHTSKSLCISGQWDRA